MAARIVCLRGCSLKLGKAISSSPRSSSTNYYSTASSCLDISGVYPPITTPFTFSEDIAWDQLKSNVDKLNQIPSLKGYLVQGSNGEYCYLTWSERVEMIKKVRQWASKEKLVLAGSGMESTADTIKMTGEMAAAGADAAVVITPSYFKNRMNDEAMYQHFTRVADDSPIPIILYSVPANTTIDLSVQVAAKLSKHPNIIGMKDSGGDITKMSQLVHQTKGQNFGVLAGSAGFLLPALQVGAVGGICALANALPKEVGDLSMLFKEDMKAAVELQHRLVLPNSLVTRVLGVPALKKAMDWLGFYGGPVRRPLLSLTSEEEEKVRKAFVNEGFLEAAPKHN